MLWLRNLCSLRNRHNKLLSELVLEPSVPTHSLLCVIFGWEVSHDGGGAMCPKAST